MRNVLKKIDKVSESTLNVAGSALRFAAREFRDHPFTTPFVMLGGTLTVMEAYARWERWDRHKHQEAGLRATEEHLAELAMQKQAEVILPETIESD